MQGRFERIFFLTALTLAVVCLAVPEKAGASTPCTASKPQISWTNRNTYWKSFADYRDRLLTVEMEVTTSSANASGITILSSDNSDGVATLNDTPWFLGDLSTGGIYTAVLKNSIPTDVSHFRTSLYVTAQDDCDNSYYYPVPNDTVTQYSIDASDHGLGGVTIKVNWDEGFDSDLDALATIKYRLYPSNWWDSILPDYTLAGNLSHTGNSDQLVINNLLPGRYYDFTVEVSDDDGVEGARAQLVSAKLLRDDRFLLTNILNNPHPGVFDEVRVRDFYNNSLLWYSAQSVWEYGNSYEYLFRNGANYEYSIVRGKTAWQSAVARNNNKIYIAGEMPRPEGGHGYRAMVGMIDENANPPRLSTYLLPDTDDCNEIIGFAHDVSGNRLLTGERNAGTPLRDSAWPNGGGLWSIPINTIGQQSTYARIYQDPLNRSWDKMVIFNGRLYALLNGTLISAALSDVPTFSLMPASAWRTEISSNCHTMIVSPYHGLVVAQTHDSYYLMLRINDGSGWSSIGSNKVFPGEGLYELPDHRFLVLRDKGGNKHHVAVASVDGEWENLGVFAGGLPSNNYAVDENSGSIYYGTVTPGKVWKVTYMP